MPNEHLIHTNRGDESSVKDTTKSKKFFDKLFDRKKKKTDNQESE